ncbi:MAG: hypothetical protein HPY76_03720 [Anaerolineae bacterium]|nr:hypothetical protein [Anaerolineae bacterium]
MTEKNKVDFTAVFQRLKRIYAGYCRGSLKAGADDAANYTLTSPPVPQNRGNEVWFGGVQVKKNYVSCYLMPVYVYPELLEGLSPALKKHMQGKSCFNFTRVDEELLAEFEQLSQRSYRRFLEGGWIN